MIVSGLRKACSVCKSNWNRLSTRQKVVLVGSTAIYGIGVVAGCYATEKSFGFANTNINMVNSTAVSSFMAPPICKFPCGDRNVRIYNSKRSYRLFPEECKKIVLQAEGDYVLKVGLKNYVMRKVSIGSNKYNMPLEMVIKNGACSVNGLKRAITYCVNKELRVTGACSKALIEEKKMKTVETLFRKAKSKYYRSTKGNNQRDSYKIKV